MAGAAIQEAEYAWEKSDVQRREAGQGSGMRLSCSGLLGAPVLPCGGRPTARQPPAVPGIVGQVTLGHGGVLVETCPWGMRQASFKREVAETVLRCAQQGFDPSFAVVELNGLKIAEDRTFADCASAILTTLLGLCFPAAHKTKPEYQGLYPAAAANSGTPVSCTVEPFLNFIIILYILYNKHNNLNI